eukprot:CAMPEP_0205918748 /NCGR_PEP_ID=MMETSP1325-20131115/9993_1 /ASSEMBLY_ACC=CAM_ASM_000708 /TAXON_ID=236786 /ORGANISM="Florenciella sp., Strain RCC1007" /LENGTH=31 /DNA_ID= /DNA_START= /DNA_END= /DNA_ORIENTATION=
MEAIPKMITRMNVETPEEAASSHGAQTSSDE